MARFGLSQSERYFHCLLRFIKKYLVIFLNYLILPLVFISFVLTLSHFQEYPLSAKTRARHDVIVLAVEIRSPHDGLNAQLFAVSDIKCSPLIFISHLRTAVEKVMECSILKPNAYV